MISERESRAIALEDCRSCWMMDINMEVEDYDNSKEEELYKNWSIYRVPTFAIELKQAVFTPRVVSFGPFHHGQHNLRFVEDYKSPALVHFLMKAGRPLEEFVRAMEPVAERLKGAYSRLDEEWRDQDRFIKLMIIDGSFMLQILRLKCWKSIQELGYPANHPIFGEHGKLHKLPYIQRDMVLLENQLPLLVLKQLIVVERGSEEGVEKEINSLALQFWDIKEGHFKHRNLGLHMLDVLRQSKVHGFILKRDPPQPGKPSNPYTSSKKVRTAMALHEAGVSFKKGNDDEGLNIIFKNGILTLPKIVVDDAFECTYRNLMAFEHLHDGAGNEITSYICFMDEMINSEKDVNLLESKGIIRNALGSEKEVANLFNNLTKEITLDPSSLLGKTRDDLHQYSTNPFNNWIANLRHTHFRNPWTLTSVIAAVILLALTVEQAVYTALSYYLQKK